MKDISNEEFIKYLEEVNSGKCSLDEHCGMLFDDTINRLKVTEAENKKLREFIKEENPKNRHDHDCFHDDCRLCTIEKRRYNKLVAILPEVFGDAKKANDISGND